MEDRFASLSETWIIKFNTEDEKDRSIILSYLENPNNDTFRSVICEMIHDDIKERKLEAMKRGYLNSKQRIKLWCMSHRFFRWNTFEIEDW